MYPERGRERGEGKSRGEGTRASNTTLNEARRVPKLASRADWAVQSTCSAAPQPTPLRSTPSSPNRHTTSHRSIAPLAQIQSSLDGIFCSKETLQRNQRPSRYYLITPLHTQHVRSPLPHRSRCRPPLHVLGRHQAQHWAYTRSEAGTKQGREKCAQAMA